MSLTTPQGLAVFRPSLLFSYSCNNVIIGFATQCVYLQTIKDTVLTFQIRLGESRSESFHTDRGTQVEIWVKIPLLESRGESTEVNAFYLLFFMSWPH